MMANRREWAHFDLAALGLGLVVVPLYPNDHPENVRHILCDSGSRLLLLQDGKQLEALAEIGDTLDALVRTLILEGELPAGLTGSNAIKLTDWLPNEATEVVNRVTDPDDLASIVYTSGTTGPPKGVMLTHRNILWNARASLELVPAFPSDRFLSFLPLSHALERTAGYYLPMTAGAAVAYARSIAQLADDLQVMRATVLISVPRIFERVHERIREKLEAGPAPAKRLFEAALRSGWHAFEHAQGRRGWSPDLLAAPLLDRIVGGKIRARLGGHIRVAVCGGAPLSPEIGRFFIVLATGEKVSPVDMEIAIAADPVFSQVLVVGEQRPHLAALVVLEPAAYQVIAEREGLSAEQVPETGNSRLEEILVQRIADRLKAFPGYATIPRVAVAVEPWTIETGMMTPTMKLKRGRITEHMADAIEYLYADYPGKKR